MKDRTEPSIPLTSITYAIKAQNLLLERGIRTIIVRDERYLSGKGCGYSLIFRPGTDMNRVMSILQEHRIKLAEP